MVLNQGVLKTGRAGTKPVGSLERCPPPRWGRNLYSIRGPKEAPQPRRGGIFPEDHAPTELKITMRCHAIKITHLRRGPDPCYVSPCCAGLSCASVTIRIIRAIWQRTAYLRRCLRLWAPHFPPSTSNSQPSTRVIAHEWSATHGCYAVDSPPAAFVCPLQ